MRKTPLFVAASVAAFSSFATAQNDVQKQLAEINERLDAIEDQQAETTERVGGRALVQAFSAESLDFGGHVTSLFSHINGETDSETGHVVSLVELFVKAKLDSEWSIFATPGFYTFNGALLDNPATPTANGDPLFTADSATTENLFISRIYGEWAPDDRFHLQGGVVGSPHGVTNREYFIPSRQLAAANLHTRLFLSNQLYPQIVEGARASGKFLVGESDWIEYDAYFGTEQDSASDPIAGARLAYAFRELGLTVAANYGRGNRQATASPGTNFGVLQLPFAPGYNRARDYQFGGIDVDLRSGSLLLRGEAYYSAEDGFEDQRALSVEGTWFATPEWAVTYRFDYYDAGSDLNLFLMTPAVMERGTSTEHVVGLSYSPNPSVRLRLDVHHNNLPNTDDTVQFVNLSWSLSF